MGYGIIYGAYHKEKDKWYIGQTTRTLDKRKKQHFRDARKNRSNSYFHNAIRKYDESIFEWYVIDDTCENIDELNEMEYHYIQQYKSFGNSGYNLTTGGGDGSCGMVHSEESKRKMSENRKGKCMGEDNPFYGKTHSEEWRDKMSGDKNPLFGKTGDKNPFYGKNHTNETKQKIRESKSKTWIVEDPDGHIVEVVNMCEFCQQNDLSTSAMSRVASGQCKQHKGFRVEKIENVPAPALTYDRTTPLMEVFFGV